MAKSAYTVALEIQYPSVSNRVSLSYFFSSKYIYLSSGLIFYSVFSYHIHSVPASVLESF